MSKAMLVDTTKCTACRGCQVACKQWNQLPAVTTRFSDSLENPPDFRGAYTRVLFNEKSKNGQPRWLFAKTQCMHCTDAACIMVCPTGAIHRSEYGTVVIDRAKCIGCNYCIANCNFGVIYYDRQKNCARKCDMCHDRLLAGWTPACAKACLSGCLRFGEREDIVQRAQNAVAGAGRRGIQARLYGRDELGGLGWIYVLADAPEEYRLPVAPEPPLAARIWDVIFQPLRVLAGLAIVFGLWSNRQHAAKLEPPAAKPPAESQKAVGAGK